MMAAPDATAPTSRDLSARQLGRRIKLLRVSCGLTLKELEDRGGISATHVSEIERGKASPTVGALGRIARALGVRPAALVEPLTLPETTTSRAGERGARRMQWGTTAIESLTEPVESAVIGAYVFTLPMGREAALSHQHEGEEWLTVMSGVVEIQVEAETHVLREGDSIHFRAHRRHSYANLISSPSVLLVACRPRLAL